tara:strand:- start:9821 stop:10657 length:837 start_codon:yes stop_codon:yes gene_type:complete
MKTSIQRILVPLDPSEFTEAATLRACEVAMAHGAKLAGLAVLDSPGIRSQVSPVDMLHWPLVRDAIMDLEADAQAKIVELQNRFAWTCKSHRISHVESDLTGVPANMILEASVLHDLVVMGLRTYYHFETREGAGKSLSQVLTQTSTPILAVPKVQSREPFQRVMIAYDGSLSAGRALRDFCGFAEPYDFEITILTAHPDESHAEFLLNQAADCLHVHGINGFSLQNFKSDSIPVSALEGAELVVAGIHSKRHFKDLVVGSFTREIIDRGDTAMFLSH